MFFFKKTNEIHVQRTNQCNENIEFKQTICGVIYIYKKM